jgi:hypothetical protein
MLGAATRRGALIALTCSALAGLTAPAASAAARWLAPLDLSAAGQTALNPHVKVDPQGNTVAVWERFDGTTYIVQSAVRPAGGVWQAPVDLSVAGQYAEVPQLALDPQGNAVAVWTRRNGTNFIIQSASRPAGGVWQAPVDLSLAGGNASNPQVAVDPQGNAVAVWFRSNATNYIIQAAARPAGGVWQAPVDLSVAGQNAYDPQVALDSQGNAVAVWERSNGSNFIIQSAWHAAGSAVWSGAVDLSGAGQSASSPQVAFAPLGNAVAVWHRYNGANWIIQSAADPVGGPWQAPVDLSVAGQSATYPHVAFTPLGNAVTVWQRYDGTNYIIQSAARTAGGSWLVPVDLSAGGGDAGMAQLAVDPQGDAVAVWRRYDGTNYIIQSAARTAGGSWLVPVDLSAGGAEAGMAQVAVDPQGDAVAVWTRSDGTHYVIQGAGYDAAGPLLGALSAPSAGVAGQPVAFSVSPFDVWSMLGPTSWSFGDGSSTIGTGVTHSYAAAGSYKVTLTSADVLGNVTSAATTITIAPAPTTVVIDKRRTPPVLSSASVTNKRFRVASKDTAISAKRAPRGTAFRFTLSAAAKVRITFTRAATGLRQGRRCLAPTTTLRRAHAKRCTRALTVGTLTRASLPQGRERIAFTGRVGHRALSPGAYKAMLSASNAAGRSTPVTLSFTVVRRR